MHKAHEVSDQLVPHLGTFIMSMLIPPQVRSFYPSFLRTTSGTVVPTHAPSYRHILGWLEILSFHFRHFGQDCTNSWARCPQCVHVYSNALGTLGLLMPQHPKCQINVIKFMMSLLPCDLYQLTRVARGCSSSESWHNGFPTIFLFPNLCSVFTTSIVSGHYKFSMFYVSK